MRGRRPGGPELVERLDGSAEAKRRMRLILATIAGQMSVTDVCAELEICAQRFWELRAAALEAGLAALEPKPTGRPARPAPDPEVARQAARIAELEAELEVARVRADLVGHLPTRRRRGVAKKSSPRSARAKESPRSGPGNSKPT